MDNSCCNIANINPFRYRGYYFDKETGLYYLQSRYYDPEIGRFINADSMIILSSVGTNLFNYCGNNSVNRSDPLGLFYEEIFSINLQQFKDFTHSIKKLTDGSSPKINRTVVDVGLAVTGHVAEKWNFAKLASATNGFGVVLMIYDVVALFFPSYKEELYTIFSMCYEMLYRFDDTNNIFDIYLLFGSHSNEFKIEAYQKSIYWSISKCHFTRKETKQFVGASIFDFRFNRIYTELRDILVDKNCYPIKRNVAWEYTYF